MYEVCDISIPLSSNLFTDLELYHQYAVHISNWINTHIDYLKKEACPISHSSHDLWDNLLMELDQIRLQ